MGLKTLNLFKHNFLIFKERPLDCHKIDESALKPAFGVKKDSDAPKLSKADNIKQSPFKPSNVGGMSAEAHNIHSKQ